MQVEKQQLEPDMKQWICSNWERSWSRMHIDTLISLLCRVHHMKCQAGWITSWNQDCWEKYQQFQICRRNHSNGRKWRGTKEPLGESERDECNSRLKTQHSKKKKKTHTHKVMVFGPITVWQIDGEKVENSDRFIFLGSIITPEGDCSH